MCFGNTGYVIDVILSVTHWGCKFSGNSLLGGNFWKDIYSALAHCYTVLAVFTLLALVAFQ